MKIKAFAKINLALGVLDKRADGYHNIESIMQSVSLCDDIEIDKMNSGINLSCSNETILGSDNICHKAAEIFIKKAAENGVKLGCRIEILKRIPLAAGLGGGSADAAAVLVGLNRLCEDLFCYDELCKMALTLGADVPFCIEGGTKLAKGIGEELTAISPLPDCFVIIAKKGVKSSTGDMYRKLDNLKAPKLPNTSLMLKGLENSNLEECFMGAYNSFEQACDAADEVREALKGIPFIYCGLSGAGPSVISVFESESDAITAQNALKSLDYEAFLTTPVDKANKIIE